MASHTLAYRLRIATIGAPDVDGFVDLTLTNEIAAEPQVGGQFLDPVRGRAATRPWRVRILDSSEVFTAFMSDAGGRMRVIGRLCDVSEQVDGGAWVKLVTGRIANVVEDQLVFDIEIHDERIMERTADAFTDNTTTIFPPGIGVTYRGLETTSLFAWEVRKSFTPSNTVILRINLNAKSRAKLLHDRVLSLIEDDMKANRRVTPGAGVFKNLRIRLLGAQPSFPFAPPDIDTFNAQAFDKELLGFGGLGTEVTTEAPTQNLQVDPANIGVVWVTWGGPPPAVGTLYWGFLHMFSMPPRDGLPKHIGGAEGIHPFDLAEQMLTAAGVRVSTAAFQTLKDSPKYGKTFYRVTAENKLSEWLEDNIYAPNLVMPVVDEDGRLAPIDISLPDATIDPGTLFRFDTAVLMGRPAWEHRGRDQISQVKLKFRTETQKFPPFPPTKKNDEGRLPDADIDGLVTEEESHTKVLSNPAGGARGRTEEYQGQLASQNTLASIIQLVQTAVLGTEILDRFGDGPILGRLAATRAAAGVKIGDFVIISSPTFPNPQTGTRGGDRLVQITNRVSRAAGFEFEFLDAGPNSQPLTTPTVSAVKNATAPLTAIDVTISGVDAAAETWRLQLAYDPGVSAPPDDSQKWFDGGVVDLPTTATTIGDLRPGEKVWVRARVAAKGRIRSLWSSAVSVQLDGLPVPSSLIAANVAGCSALLTWTNGDDTYRTEVLLNDVRVGIALQGQTQWSLIQLEPSTAYTAKVRHVTDDGFAGTEASVGFTTTATPDTGPDVIGVDVLVGAVQ